MELVSGAERNRLIETVAQDAFHLELRDDYSVPLEDGPYDKWLAGVSTTTSWTRGCRWFDGSPSWQGGSAGPRGE